MKSTRSTILGGSRLLKSYLPLVTLATLLAVSSAATCFGESASQPNPRAVLKKVVGRGRLTGTRELQQVVTWRTGDAAHLAIESTGRNPRSLWQAAEPFPVIDINSVHVTDLDGDGLTEIVGLWCQGASVGCQLRIFHWDRGAQSFTELKPKGEASAGTIEVQRFRIQTSASHRRITVYKRAPTGWPIVAGGEFEVSGSEIVRVSGGTGVTTHSESGIEGQAVISPVRPGPTREGQTDTAPFKTTLVILRTSDGTEVTRVETGSDGRFRVMLPPGTYKVGPPLEPRRRLPRGGEETVTVVAGQYAHVTISFDSGMR
jgi:hypothetical protein